MSTNKLEKIFETLVEDVPEEKLFSLLMALMGVDEAEYETLQKEFFMTIQNASLDFLEKQKAAGKDKRLAVTIVLRTLGKQHDLLKQSFLESERATLKKETLQ